jgi:hypothetical protein
MPIRALRRLSLVLAAVACWMLAAPPSAEANPFKNFGRAVKSGAKEVGHAVKGGARTVKGSLKGGAGARSGVRAGGRGKHHGGGHARHGRRKR